MSSRPWLSVLLPVMNGENYLSQALESLAAQPDDIECLVIDGGSTDSTPTIIDSFRDRLNLRLFQFPRESNWVGKTNFALTVAEGEFVSILPHDDVWLRNRAGTLRAVAEVTHSDFIFHPVKFMSGVRVVGQWNCPVPAYPEPLDREVLLERLLVQNFIAAPATAVRRLTALSVGGWDETLWYTADWDFCLKIAAAGRSCYVPEPLAAFRIHPYSLTMSRSRHAKEFRQQMETVLDRHINLLPRGKTSEAVYRASQLSATINTMLASTIHGEVAALLKSFAPLFKTPPHVWRRYLRNSRIFERIKARLRSGLLLSR